MADCFSLPNAAELVKQLIMSSEGTFVAILQIGIALEAANAIEALLAENAKLKENAINVERAHTQ